MHRLLLRGASVLAGPGLEYVESSDILVSGTMIEEIGSVSKSADEEIDCSGLLAMPGFVDAHVHINDAPLKDLGIGKGLDEIVHPVSGLKRKGLNALTVGERAERMSAGLAEMVKSGITTAVNFHEEDFGILEKLSGITGNFGILVNLCRPQAYSTREQIEKDERLPEAAMRSFRSQLEKFHGVGLSGTNEYSDRALEDIASAKAEIRAIHAAESDATARSSLTLTGQTEVERAMEHFHPTFLVHLTNAGEDDLGLVRESGASAVCCPRSNAILGAGVPPVQELLSLGVDVGLGTDNLMFNSPDMFREMDYTSRILRGTSSNPSAVESRTVLRLATSAGAAAVGCADRCGAIAKGLDADIQLIDMAGRLSGTHDIYSGIVHRASPSDVVATMKRGEFLHAAQRIRRVK